MDGIKEKKTRMVILLSSPAMALWEQLLCVLPMEEKTGAAIADSIVFTLVEHGLENSVMGIVAETTTANFGQYSGAVTLLEDLITNPVLPVECQHHVRDTVGSVTLACRSYSITSLPGLILTQTHSWAPSCLAHWQCCHATYPKDP